mgnify:CR=1 FL=1
MLFKNQENVKYHLTIDDETRVKIVNGNSKLGKGIYAVNLLPGDTPLTLKQHAEVHAMGVYKVVKYKTSYVLIDRFTGAPAWLLMRG